MGVPRSARTSGTLKHRILLWLETRAVYVGFTARSLRPQVAAPDPSMKGKVLEVLGTGYLIHDKVLSYAKVVVGQ